MAVLMKLSLHFPRSDLEPAQFKLVLDDMVTDLEPFAFYQVERSCNSWRTSGERFFPTSGQIIAKIHEENEASIARARGAESWRALPPPQGKHPREFKPWRDILRENGRQVPPDHSPTAQALDLYQEGAARQGMLIRRRKTVAVGTGVSGALRNRLGIDAPQRPQ